MRKHLFGVGALCLLSLAGLAVSHGILHAEARDVAIQEMTLLGDVSAADGLTARVRQQHDYRLFWDTAFAPGGTAETDFRASIQPDLPDGFGKDTYVYMALDLHRGYESLNGSIDFDDLSPLQLAVAKQLDGQIAAGATLQTSFPMEDFLDAYPTEFNLFIGGNRLRETNPFLSDLNSAFQFPLQKEEFILVNAKANAGRRLCKLHIDTTLDRRIYEGCIQAVSQDTLYFVPEVRLEDGTLLDYTNTPNGYGIYAIPINKEVLTLDDLHFFAPLDQRVSVMDLAVTGDQQSLLLVTNTAKAHPQLLRFDLESGAQLQALPLSAADWTRLFCEEDRILAVQSGNRFQFFVKEADGSYAPQLSGSAPVSDDWSFPLDSVRATAWNGERLALLATDWRRTDTITQQPLVLLICDASGVLYAGELDSSLDRCQYPFETNEGYLLQNYCDYLEPDPCELTWN